jgi:hypothetical protein
VQAARLARIQQRERADEVHADHLVLVVLAPVHVRPPGQPGAVEDVRRLDRVDLRRHLLDLLQPRLGHDRLVALGAQQRHHLLANPAGLAAKDEHLHRRHRNSWREGGEEARTSARRRPGCLREDDAGASEDGRCGGAVLRKNAGSARVHRCV